MASLRPAHAACIVPWLGCRARCSELLYRAGTRRVEGGDLRPGAGDLGDVLVEGGREGRGAGYVFQATDYADLKAGEDVWPADGGGDGGHWASDRGAVAAVGRG